MHKLNPCDEERLNDIKKVSQESTLSLVDKKRLENALKILSQNNIRFTVAETVRRTGENKGNVSNFLNGKKPMPERFYKKFLEAFSAESTNDNSSCNIESKLSRLVDIVHEQQAILNVVLTTLWGISSAQNGKEIGLVSAQIKEAIKIEKERLADEFLKKI